MVRYIAVDSGKFATKVAEYDHKTKKTTKFSIRTKVNDGDLRDDAIEKNTFVVEIGGKTYKVGNGARGTGAALENDKATDVHKICTLTAIAMLASRNETDEINVAIGLPAKDWANVSKRIDFKDYILPKGECKITIKKDGSAEPIEKTFVIKERFVFPESIGALFMDETIANSADPTSITGVLDIGNLHLNATLWQGAELLQDKSTTAELGGAILIQELSQELTTNIAACDELITANILKSADRQIPNNGNLTDEQVAQSKELIKHVLRSHAEKIKRCCQARNWSLDVTNIVAIGGTSADLAEELREVFGNIVVLENSAYCNVLGYLRMMCSRIKGIEEVIPL